MSFTPTHLKDRTIVEVIGPDAATFLQGLITNDVTKASGNHAIYAALLTPQGKIVYDFLVTAADGGFRLDCAKQHAPDLAARLRKYKLRAKVTITERSDVAVIASTTPVDRAFADPRLAALGFRAFQTAVEATGSETAYHAHRIALGVPDSSDLPPETLFPLDCNFEELHGVDFDKGCYVGQELTARMKHRATARRRILRVEAASPLPPPGTPLKRGDTELGEMLGSIGAHGLAIIRLDRLNNAAEADAGGLTVSISRPPYPLTTNP
ncbi:MAG: folate-binding protein YgfZ [Alphaproteobacteria bacterium]|nr:folate-binding protein YgfZ [Alphaproteobacteria bacterium]